LVIPGSCSNPLQRVDLVPLSHALPASISGSGGSK
jgi:hypothetical protein